MNPAENQELKTELTIAWAAFIVVLDKLNDNDKKAMCTHYAETLTKIAEVQ